VVGSVKIKSNSRENDRMSSIRHGISVFAIASSALVSSCTSALSKRGLESDAASLDSDTSISAPTNAEQLAERLLNLLERLRTPQDLSPTNIQRYMGASVQPSSNGPSRFEAGGRISVGWTYSLETVPSSYGVAPHALRLRFDDGRDNGSDMSSICRFDYEQYKTSLENIGFESRVIMGSMRQINFNHESGSGLQVIVYVRRESTANPQKKCVDIVLTDFMPGSPKTPRHPK
jgi:hypothetical protein